MSAGCLLASNEVHIPLVQSRDVKGKNGMVSLPGCFRKGNYTGLAHNSRKLYLLLANHGLFPLRIDLTYCYSDSYTN